MKELQSSQNYERDRHVLEDAEDRDNRVF